MKKRNNLVWDIVRYGTLSLCIISQGTVGYAYLIAQAVHLIANRAGVVRDIALRLSRANIVRDIAFTGITIAPITMYFI